MILQYAYRMYKCFCFWKFYHTSFKRFNTKLWSCNTYYFLLHTLGESFGTSVFLINLHVLGCPEHDLTIFGKCLSVCDTHFVAALEQKLMDRNSCKLIIVAPYHKLVLIRFWGISLSRWRCYSGFFAKFCGRTRAKTNGHKFMKIYI